jgi:REP element-mobilizing transposase RayT
MRVEYAGAIYHVMSRGDRREDIFLDDVDRQDFLKTLAEACQKTGFQVHAYCLMRNHFHLVIETPNANLVAGMAWLLSAYTIRLNHRHKLFGHVFAGRYKAQAVDGSGGGYLRTVCDYAHMNPVRAGLVQRGGSAFGLPLEQSGVVRGGAGASSGMDSGGPVAGRARDWGGFGRRTAGLRAPDGSQAREGKR